MNGLVEDIFDSGSKASVWPLRELGNWHCVKDMTNWDKLKR